MSPVKRIGAKRRTIFGRHLAQEPTRGQTEEVRSPVSYCGTSQKRRGRPHLQQCPVDRLHSKVGQKPACSRRKQNRTCRARNSRPTRDGTRSLVIGQQNACKEQAPAPPDPTESQADAQHSQAIQLKHSYELFNSSCSSVRSCRTCFLALGGARAPRSQEYRAATWSNECS